MILFNFGVFRSKEPKMYELKDGHAFTTDAEKLEKLKLKQKAAKAPLGLRLQSETGEDNDDNNMAIDDDQEINLRG
eukprot:Awhi_evm1s11875